MTQDVMKPGPAPILADPPRNESFPPYATIAARLMPLNGCVLWLGQIHAKTGPLIKFHGRQVQVHRALWFYRFGLLPPFRLRRTCEASGCVAPEHRALYVFQ
jgi:hypothetical protein